MKIKINNRISFDTNKPPLIVAEISANHNGNKKKFLKLIKQAALAGADLIKIQTYEPEDITIKSKKKIYKLNKGLWKNKYLYDLYKKSHTPFKWHKKAFAISKKLNVTLFSTPFSIRAVDFLERFKVPIYKIASLEITDFALIKRTAKCKKPIVISTGCASINEINNCINLIRKYHNKIILLHSVTRYPTKENESNIARIKVLKKRFKGIPIGLSDHTNDINSSLAATSLGIVMIEKHFVINSKSKTLDKEFSIDKNKFKQLKIYATKIFNLLNKKNIEDIPNKNQRRSVYAKTDIKKGVKLSEKNIVSLRPKIGICSSKYFKILNKVVKKDIKKDNPIYKSSIESFK